MLRSMEHDTRASLITELRNELAHRANGDMSICRLAAETGVFCRGFRRYSDEELRQRYDWIAKKNPAQTRSELEDVADRWQMARQEVDRVPTACDVQQIEHDGCNGWDDFSDEELSRFLTTLKGQKR